MGRTGMIGTAAAVVVVFVALFGGETAAAAPVAGYPQPPGCRGSYECAPYRVIYSEKEYEIRSYTAAKWTATKPINSSSYTAATNKGFDILFAYIQGKNAQGAKIDMTAPVIVDIVPSPGPFCNSTFVVHFYLPSKFQSNPPASPEVQIVTLPKKPNVAVRRFGGFMNDANIGAEAAKLRESLKKSRWERAVAASMMACGNCYSVAGYNSPFEFTARVNEIMFWF